MIGRKERVDGFLSSRFLDPTCCSAQMGGNYTFEIGASQAMQFCANVYNNVGPHCVAADAQIYGFCILAV